MQKREEIKNFFKLINLLKKRVSITKTKIKNLINIKEKPHFNFLVNVGLYVINPKVLKLIPSNKIYHMTNLIEDAQKKGKKIGVYPIDDSSWIDIGQWTEYQKAVEQL